MKFPRYCVTGLVFGTISRFQSCDTKPEAVKVAKRWLAEARPVQNVAIGDRKTGISTPVN